jgi:hypothetical protein
MTNAARSVLWFGVYLVALGLALVVAPNVVIGRFGFPPTNEPWIQVAGVLAFVLGYYDIQCARAEVRRFLELTIPARLGVVASFAAFVMLNLASPILLAFASVDLAGTLWTALAPDGPHSGASNDTARLMSPA